MVREMMEDKQFTEMLAGILADKVFEKVNKDLDKLAMRVKDLEQKINIIQGEKDEMSIRVEEIEQSNKNTQLRVLGIPESKEYSTETQIKQMFQTKLGIMDGVTLQQCYRVGSVKNKTASRPIIVKFENVKQKNQVYLCKNKLKGSRIVILEDLVRSRYELLLLAKEKLGKAQVWTLDGKIYTNVNNKKICLKTEEDILKIRI
nr:unnamed protein product [Callosobruchus analis]